MLTDLDLNDPRAKKLLFYLYTHEAGYYDDLECFKSSFVCSAESEGLIKREGYHGYPYWRATKKLDEFVDESGIVTLRWKLMRKILRWLNS